MTEQKSKPMTAADAAHLVRRRFADMKNGKTTGRTKLVAVKSDEVFAFREYDTHVMVCTTDGRKLRGEKK